MEHSIAFLSRTFTDTQRKWSTREQEAYRVYYAVIKWNYYLQVAEVIIWNYHKPMAKFLNRKNAKDKVNRWGLELATYNIIFKWILGAWKQSSWLSLQTGRDTTWQASHSSDAMPPTMMDPYSTPEVELYKVTWKKSHFIPETDTALKHEVDLFLHMKGITL